jgi:hypothetical protein
MKGKHGLDKDGMSGTLRAGDLECFDIMLKSEAIF